LETRDIWRQIGVSPDRILPFGADDNFWEMGVTGPCGPCTEIHVDHIPGRKLAADKVNMGYSDLTEIWNLVFIQYNRNADGSLKELPCRHVDTGMGLERLVAILQGKRSNYDTDLFEPLFKAIHKISRKVPVYHGRFKEEDEMGFDTGYRILADHTRMVTVALADGMFPDQNHKLRRVMRKAMLVSQQKFGVECGLLTELTNYVADSLGEVYPEIRNRLKQTQLIINHEEEVLRSLRLGAAVKWQEILNEKPELRNLDIVEMPGLVAGYHELLSNVASAGVGLEDGRTKKKQKTDVQVSETTGVMIPGELAFKLYDTYGLEETVIQELARLEGFRVDVNGFRHLLNTAKVHTKESFRSDAENEQLRGTIDQLAQLGLNFTEDTLKYSYVKENDRYIFSSPECEVKAIIVEGKVVSKILPGISCSIVLDRTSFYHKAGGQSSDTGRLVMKDGTQFCVADVTNVGGYLLHHGYVRNEGNSICVGDVATAEVDGDRRLGNMRNHTATHLLNAALHTVLTVTYQKSSQVTGSYLVFDFSVYGETFNVQNIRQLEEVVHRCVCTAVPVKRHTVSADELFSMENVTLVLGEVYPEEGIHIIEVSAEGLLMSREACCGTHVLNTADIGDFCIVGMKSAGSGTRTLTAVTGDCATSARQEGYLVAEKVAALRAEVESICTSDVSLHQAEQLDVTLQKLKQKLASGTGTLPYAVRSEQLLEIDSLGKRLKESARGCLRDALETEMEAVMATNQLSFLVHFLQCSSTVDSIPLEKATRMCPQIPVLLLAHSQGTIKARCCVPKALVSQSFNAQMWMQTVLKVLRSQGAVPRGQDPCLVFYMKSKKVPSADFNTLVKDAVQSAVDFAKLHLGPAKSQADSSSLH
jgi:alanyl-tRNA synthetase